MKRTKKRRAWLAVFALILVGGVVAAAALWDRPSGAPPDIVLVVVDTLRADHLGLYGHERQTSPEIDALADQGLVFDRAFAHSGWTLPSTASLLTGLYPSEHGAVRDPHDRDAFGRMREEVDTLAEVLSANGYRTGAVVNNVFLAPYFGFGRGFDVYDHEGSTNSKHRSAKATVEAALKWLDAAESDRPSFLLVHFMEPHLDYAPPSSVQGQVAFPNDVVSPPVTAKTVAELSAGTTGRPSEGEQQAISRIYDEEIRAVDAEVGRIASALAERDRPVWIWITSDHGEELWDHGSFEHGHHLHGELVRAPLIAVGPDVEPTRIDTPVQHVDLFQTLVGLAGAEPPDGTHGTDVLHIVRDPGATAEDRPILHEDCLYGPWRAAVTAGRFRVVVELPSRKTSLWKLDERGQEDRRIVDDSVEDARLSQLVEQLYELRGRRDVEPVSGDRRTTPDSVDLEQLRSLGYVQ